MHRHGVSIHLNPKKILATSNSGPLLSKQEALPKGNGKNSIRTGEAISNRLSGSVLVRVHCPGSELLVKWPLGPGGRCLH